MPYTYLEDIATADAAFEVTGRSLEELFRAAADATMNIMVEDLSTIERKKELAIRVENPALDLLLYNFLNELVYYKDAERLLLRVDSVKIGKEDTKYTLSASAWGEVRDPEKHSLSADVKAVTLHRLSLEKTEEGFRATVILDI